MTSAAAFNRPEHIQTRTGRGAIRGLFAFSSPPGDFDAMRNRDILLRYYAGELTRKQALAALKALKSGNPPAGHKPFADSR